MAGVSRALRVEIAAHSRAINAIDLHPTSMLVRKKTARKGRDKTASHLTQLHVAKRVHVPPLVIPFQLKPLAHSTVEIALWGQTCL